MPSDEIRNVAVVGHKGAGKTSLVEAMLYVASVTPKLGGVGDVIAFGNAGAYTLEMMQPCNAQPRAGAYAVDRGEVTGRSIRAAQASLPPAAPLRTGPNVTRQARRPERIISACGAGTAGATS